jgi:hypothetical protein
MQFFVTRCKPDSLGSPMIRMLCNAAKTCAKTLSSISKRNYVRRCSTVMRRKNLERQRLSSWEREVLRFLRAEGFRPRGRAASAFHKTCQRWMKRGRSGRRSSPVLRAPFQHYLPSRSR